MNIFRLSLFVAAIFVADSMHAATAVHQFLSYVYGADGIEVEKVCWPNDDVWMLRGARNEAGLAELASEKVAHGPNEVIWENIQNSLCILEVREGKIDPAFMLDQVYTLHRQLVLQFVYATLTQDMSALRRLATKPTNVDFGGAKAPAGGDLDVYQGIVALLPVIRTSQPFADKAAKTVSYRVPLGSRGLTLRLIKRGSAWMIDTDSRTRVPLEFFFR